MASIVKQTFEVFSGPEGSMGEAEFLDFCAKSRGVCADNAKKIFSSVTETYNEMSLRDFEEALDLLIDLGKSRSGAGASVKSTITATKATNCTSRTVTRENGKDICKSKQVLTPRGVPCESNQIRSTPSPRALLEVAEAPVKMPKAVTDAKHMSSLLQKEYGASRRMSTCSTASTASSAGSARSDASSANSSPLVTPKGSPRAAGKSLRPRTRRDTGLVRAVMSCTTK
jgi:hypothetical protein